jgi:hypothetical protein
MSTSGTAFLREDWRDERQRLIDEGSRRRCELEPAATQAPNPRRVGSAPARANGDRPAATVATIAASADLGFGEEPTKIWR